MKTTKVSRTARMFQLVLAGYSNEAAVQVVKKEYGKNVPTNTASIGWCRTQLKAKTAYAKKHNPKGLKIVSDREAKIQAIPEKATKPAAKKSATVKAAAKKLNIPHADVKSKSATAAS